MESYIIFSEESYSRTKKNMWGHLNLWGTEGKLFRCGLSSDTSDWVIDTRGDKIQW